MQETVQIDVDNKKLPVELTFDPHRWSGPQLPESYFPIPFEVNGKRYEL